MHVGKGKVDRSVQGAIREVRPDSVKDSCSEISERCGFYTFLLLLPLVPV